MPDFSLTDSLGAPLSGVPINWKDTSALMKYLKSQVLHLMVFPDFLERRDKTLAEAAPAPLEFEMSAGDGFDLGVAQAEVTISPAAKVLLRINATSGSPLFSGDVFRVAAKVPPGTGYVCLRFAGTLGVDVSGLSAANIAFGFSQHSGITFEYLKAFASAAKTTLAQALGETLTSYAIPATLGDFGGFAVGDICTVSGVGSLSMSASVTVRASVNPLATVNLPLGAGTIDVKDGAMAGLNASFSITGSFQIRVRKLRDDTVELSYLKQHGAALQAGATASAGVKVTVDGTDLLATLMGAISKESFDPTLLAGLTPNEKADMQKAVEQGIDHSVQGSLNAALQLQTDDQSVFQYEIQPGSLDDAGRDAVGRALKGDLTVLTKMEAGAQADGAIGPGLRLINSVLTQVRTQSASVRVNLLGIVNLVSISKLLSRCEILTEPSSGGIFIKETAASERISAITQPLARQEMLRKAIYDSVLATTTYRVSGAVTMPALQSEHVHFAENQNTNAATLADYLNWFAALDLIGGTEAPEIATHFSSGGASTCLLRTAFDDAACNGLFFNAGGQLRPAADYLEIGRRALAALLVAGSSDMDKLRVQVLNDRRIWPQVVGRGPTPAISDLMPLSPGDSRRSALVPLVIGDVYDIAWWADGMTKAGRALAETRAYLSGRDPATLANDAGFKKIRDKLQTTLLHMVGASKMRFHEPWGMVCLYWAAGARVASGKLTAGALTLERQHGG